MYLVAERMLRGRTVMDATQIQELLEAAATAEDGLEHVYAEGDLEGVHAVLFFRATSHECARSAAHRIMARLLERDELQGWERAQVNLG